MSCVFCRIVAGDIPARKALEDDELIAFHDIAPWAPVHLLLIPKEHVASLADVIRSKQAANRPKDQRVLPTLRALLARGPDP